MLHLLQHPILASGAALTITKPALLLCYLALQATWVSRASLALLLRPDAPEDVARHQLRILLNRAKSLPWAQTLEIQTQQVRFLIATDVAAFKAAIGRADWQAALDLYRAPLLPETSSDSPALEEWLALERQKLEAAWHEALLARVQQAVQQQDFQTASAWLERLWHQDEFDEEVFQRHLETAYLAGRREVALADFGRFERALKEEFGTAPQPKTLELQRQIVAAAPLVPSLRQIAVPLSVLRPPQLIGRERQADALQQSRAPLTAIIGEAGVGKTRFASELLPTVQIMRCIEGLENVAYAPLLPYARQHLDRQKTSLGAYFPDLAGLLPEFNPDGSPDTPSAKSRLLEAWGRLLDGLILLFDDLHWADSATLELLHFLAARGTVRLYATVRAGEISGQLEQHLLALRTERIVLMGLTQADTEQLVSSLIGTSQTHPVFSQFLWQRTGGNAFFMLEVLKSLFESGALRAEGGDWHTALDSITEDYHELSLPSRVAEVVQHRTRRLPEPVQRLLGAASVLAEGLRPQVLQQLTGFGLPEVLDALETLEQSGIVLGGRFVHDLLRQSVYQSLSQTRRQHWHSRAAKVVGTLAQAAEHHLSAGEPEAAAPLLSEVATEQRRLGLLSEARATWLRILGLFPERMDVLAQVALLENQIGLLENAEQNAKQVLEHAQDPKSRSSAHNVLASLAYGQGDLTTAAWHIEQAFALAQHFERLDADLEEIAFDVFEAQERYQECIAMLEQARVRLSHHPESGDLSVVLSSLAAIYDDLGRTAEALPLHFEALAIAKRCKNRYAQINACIPLMWALNHAERRQESVELAREALAFGEFGNSEYLRNGLGAALMNLGQLQAALEPYLHNAQFGNVTTQALAWGRLSNIYHDLGRGSERDQAVARSLAAAQQTQVPFARLRACIAVLKFGTDAQLQEILPLVEGWHSPDPSSQAELEQALLARGIPELAPM